MCEDVEALHPLLRAPWCQIIWKGSVELVHRDSKKKVCLIVTGFAVFLARPRRLLRPARILRTIAFVDVIGIRERKGTLQITTDKAAVCLLLEEQSVLETILYGIRLSLVPVDVKPLNFRGEDTTRDSFVFDSDSILRDRFVSCCCSMECLQDLTNELTKVNLETLVPVLRIDENLMSSPFFKPLIYYAALDQELRTIHVKGIDVHFFVECASELVKFGSFVDTVIFEDLIFSRSRPGCKEAMSTLMALLDAPHFLNPHVIKFRSCAFDLAESNGLADAIVKLCSKVSSLSIEKCHFNGNSLNIFFQAIFFNDCFHMINEIEFVNNENIEGLDCFIFQFMNCDWLISSKCLTRIRLVNCASDVKTIFQYVFMRENNIQLVDVSKNSFSEVLPSNLDFSALSYLILSGCQVEENALISLLEVLATRPFIGLDLSSITMNTMRSFLTKISDTNFPLTNVKVFLFDDNLLGGEDMRLLLTFLLRQKKLKHLSLNRTVEHDETVEKTVNILHSLLTRVMLESFAMGANERSDIGSKITPLLQALLENKSCKYLNLEGQSLDTAGIRCVVVLAEQTLEELNMKGRSFASLEQALEVANELCQTKLVRCPWPISNVGVLLGQVPSEKRHQVSRKYELTESTWQKRFPASDTSAYAELLFDSLQQPAVPIAKEEKTNRETMKLIQSANVSAQSSVQVSSSRLRELLLECTGERGGPLLDLNRDIRKAVSFETLLQEL